MSRHRVQTFSTSGGGFRHKVASGGFVTHTDQGPIRLVRHSCDDDTGFGEDHALIIEHQRQDISPLQGSYASGGNTYEYNNYIPTLFAPLTMSHLTVSPPSDASLATTVRARSNPSKPYISVPNFLYELKDLPGMIRDIGHLKLQAANLSLKAGRARMTGKSVGKNIANHQLSIQMGWAPLISDLQKLLDFQSRVDRKIKDLDTLFNKNGGLHRTVGDNPTKRKKTTSKQGASLWSQTNSSQGSVSCESGLGILLTCSGSRFTQSEAWGSVRWTSTALPGTHMSNKELNRTARNIVFGLYANPKAIWDAIPWTWLIGWFANVDEFLTAHSNAIPVSCSTPCIMVWTKTAYSYTRSDAWQAIFTGGDGTGELETKVRRLVSGSLSASVPFIGTREFSILSALAIQRKR